MEWWFKVTPNLYLSQIFTRRLHSHVFVSLFVQTPNIKSKRICTWVCSVFFYPHGRNHLMKMMLFACVWSINFPRVGRQRCVGHLEDSWIVQFPIFKTPHQILCNKIQTLACPHTFLQKKKLVVHVDLAQPELRVLSWARRNTKCLSDNKHTDLSIQTLPP